MRLDHLLSTEISGHCLVAGVCPLAPDVPGVWGLLVWKSGVGLRVCRSCGASRSGAGMLLGSRTATPRRLAWLVFRAPCRSPVPWWGGWARVRVRGGLRTG